MTAQGRYKAVPSMLIVPMGRMKRDIRWDFLATSSMTRNVMGRDADLGRKVKREEVKTFDTLGIEESQVTNNSSLSSITSTHY